MALLPSSKTIMGYFLLAAPHSRRLSLHTTPQPKETNPLPIFQLPEFGVPATGPTFSSSAQGMVETNGDFSPLHIDLESFLSM